MRDEALKRAWVLLQASMRLS
ncbi:Protein of unknown function [Lactobacillus delbrueckii subsp. lactis]|nr:Protein of unknown function [Lactobacillus delbrueckii subsp. lactis]